MNESDVINIQKIALFPTDEQGRSSLAKFQETNRIIDLEAGEMVLNQKKQPCIWVRYVPGIAPTLEQSDNDRLPKAKRENKSGHK